MLFRSEYKRKYTRLRTPFTVKMLTYNYTRLNPEYSPAAEGINISPNGLSFKFPRVIEKNDHLKVIIHNINGMRDEEFMASIRIVWTETKDLLSKRFGGKFVRIAPESKYKLMKLLRQNGGK